MEMADDSRVEPLMGTLPKDWEASDACLRTSDRLRLEGLIHGVRSDAMNLLLVSERSSLVEHYGRLLVRRLRAHADLIVEVVFPTTTEILLGRFNQWLSEISLEKAQASPSPDAVTRVFVVHDAEAVAETELQVMSRLAADFPGLCVRVVLLMGNESEVSRRRGLLGRRVLQWTIETPEPKELEHLLNQAVDDVQREAVSSWLERLGLKERAEEEVELDVWVRPSWAVPPPPTEAVIDKYEPPEESKISEPSPQVSNEGRLAGRTGKTWGLILLMLAVLGLCAALITAWYRADNLASTHLLQSGGLKPIPNEAVKKD